MTKDSVSTEGEPLQRCIGCGELWPMHEFRTSVKGRPYLAKKCYQCRYGERTCPYCKKAFPHYNFHHRAGCCHECYKMGKARP